MVTNAGGPAILCVDALDKKNLKLAVLSEATKKKLREIVNPEGSVENPVDLLPGGDAENYKNVVETIIADENVDAIISIFVEPVMVTPFDVVETISSIQSNKPILQVVMPMPEFWEKYRNESQKKLPVFRNPEDPAEVLSNMFFYSSSQKHLAKNRNKYNSLLRLKPKRNYLDAGFISHKEVELLCINYNIPIVKSKLIQPTKLNGISSKLFPLVLKGISPEVVHKTELNAVKLDIKNKTELGKAAKEIQKSFSDDGYKVEHFLIQPFIKQKHEFLIGGFRDLSFGPIIMFGSGGKYVEVFDDISIKSCFLSDDNISSMINSTKIGQILKGVRGEKSHNLKELKRIIKSCARMMIENPGISEFDINPIILTSSDKFIAVDVRIKAY